MNKCLNLLWGYFDIIILVNRNCNYEQAAYLLLLLLLLFVITFIQDIPETNHVSRVYNVCNYPVIKIYGTCNAVFVLLHYFFPKYVLLLLLASSSSL
jgi:hypothetical protein